MDYVKKMYKKPPEKLARVVAERAVMFWRDPREPNVFICETFLRFEACPPGLQYALRVPLMASTCERGKYREDGDWQGYYYSGTCLEGSPQANYWLEKGWVQ